MKYISLNWTLALKFSIGKRECATAEYLWRTTVHYTVHSVRCVYCIYKVHVMVLRSFWQGTFDISAKADISDQIFIPEFWSEFMDGSLNNKVPKNNSDNKGQSVQKIS